MNRQGIGDLAPSARPLLQEAAIVATYATLFLGALPLLLWTLGGRFDVLFQLPPVESGPLRVFGLFMATYGFLRMAAAMLSLRSIGHGWPISHLPPPLLVSQGPYLRLRHPVYVGFVTAFVGAGFASGSSGRAIGAGAILALGSLIYAVGFEEPRLVRRFGGAYDLYRQSTRILPIPFSPHVAAAARRAWLAMRPIVERLANRPLLVRTGPALWVTFGFFAAVGGGLVAAGIAAALAGSRVPAREADLAIVAVALAILVISRLMWLAGYWRELCRAPRLTLRRVGFVSWGGYLGLFGGLTVTALIEGNEPLRLTDHALVLALVGHAVARLGCLSYGCCYGRESPLGLTWRHPDAKVCRELGVASAAARVPTQLLSAGHSLLVAGLGFAVLRWGTSAGTATGVMLVAYALGRGAIECLRAGSRHTPWALSAGQIGAAITLVAGLLLLLLVPASPPGTPVSLADDARLAASHWPAVSLVMLLVFGAYGFHWKKIGSW